MKEYAFLSPSLLDPFREEFMPSRPVKRFLSCIEGANKEQLEMVTVIDVRTLLYFFLIFVTFDECTFQTLNATTSDSWM